jgi:hypothetical protein
MSERWKYQLKYGLFWGIFMTVFMTLFDIKEKPLAVQFSSGDFYFRAASFIAMGIFFLGYMGWREKIKRQGKP